MGDLRPHGGQFAAINCAISARDKSFGAAEINRAFQLPVTRTKNETLANLCAEWIASPEWARYTIETQRVHRISLKKIAHRYRDVPLGVFDDPRAHASLLRWRATLTDTPAATDNLFSVISSLLKYGMSVGKLRINVAAGIGDLYRLGRRAPITWDDCEVALVARKAVDLGRPEIVHALLLAALIGLIRRNFEANGNCDLRP